jgi:hypothetical protein
MQVESELWRRRERESEGRAVCLVHFILPLGTLTAGVTAGSDLIYSPDIVIKDRFDKQCDLLPIDLV